MTIASKLAALIAAIALPLGAAAAQDAAKDFPNRPIHILVPFPPGGPTDFVARIIALKMSQDWNVSVVVENRPGGNTVIAAQVVAKSPPDGYTLLTPMDTTLVLNPATGIAAPYIRSPPSPPSRCSPETRHSLLSALATGRSRSRS